MSFSQSPGFIAPPPPDPGQTLNALTAMRNYQAQSAQAQAYQGAIDPATGAFDQNRYNQLLVQQGTRGTWGAGAAMQQAGQAQSALGEGTQQQIRAQLMQLNNVNGMYTPLMQAANDPNSPSFHNVPVEKAQAALDQAHQMGLVNDTYYNQGRAILARQAPGSNVYDLVNGLQYANQSAQAQLTTQLPEQQRLDIGSGSIALQGQPTMRGYGQPVAGTGVPYGISPSGQTTGVEIKNSDNSTTTLFPTSANPAEFQQQINGYLAQHPGSVVGGSVVRPGGGGGASPGYVPYQPQGGGAPAPARPQGAPAPSAAPPAALPTPPVPPTGGPPAPPAPVAPPGGIAVPGRSPTIISPAAAAPAPVTVAGPAPGLVATPPPAPVSVGAPPPVIAGRSAPMGAGTAADTVSQAAVSLGNAAGGVPQRQAILSDMAGALSGTDPLSTGLPAEWATRWSNVVNRLPPILSSLIPGMTTQEVAGMEGFAKMAEQLRQQQAGQIGGALTNDKFASALASNPHMALSTLGNLGMIHILQGNEDAIAAKNDAWQNDKATQGWQDYQYNAWQTKYNQTAAADPRVYWVRHMSLPEINRFIDGMGGTNSPEGRRFIQNYNAAAP